MGFDRFALSLKLPSVANKHVALRSESSPGVRRRPPVHPNRRKMTKNVSPMTARPRSATFTSIAV